MNRIRLLPEQVANQIAAGEVVERPASVVKELVENALDAGAARITVEIQAGGRSLIRVTDDGLGMSRDDALLSLERHATSKIRKAEDLSAIATMGFRGEALPSIASVSRFTLTTRERDGDAPEATQVVINGGKILEVKAAGAAPGTSVEVRQLFFNLPARRKFLRTEETESAHVQHYLMLVALACPKVAFTFSKDGRLVWQLPPVNADSDFASRLVALRERRRAIHGGDEKLLDVNFTVELAEPVTTDEFRETSEDSSPNDDSATRTPPNAVGRVTPCAPSSPSPHDGGAGRGSGRGAVLSLPSQHLPGSAANSTFRVWGVIGSPGVSRATREDQHLFVNRRPVENRGLNFALMEGYHTALMKGRFPVCCLFLEINPAAVDVNIHPSKREVKFHQEAQVRRLVAQAVRETLLRFHTAAGSENAVPSSPAPRPAPGANSPEFAPFATEVPRLPVRTDKPLWPPRAPVVPTSFAPAAAPAAASPGFNPAPPSQESPLSGGVPVAPPVPLLNVPLRIIGVIGRLYVVLESDRGLVLLDQHAAHERVLFEQMLNRLEAQGNAASQKLLLPETVELSARDAHFLREQLPSLSRLGVGLSEFGERTFLLDALPPFVKAPDSRRFVIGLVDELKAAGADLNSLRLGEQTIAKTVCRHAVKANDPLAGPELQNLVDDLRRCAMPYTCPHGRPTLIEMNYRELEKKFGRAQ